VVLVVLSRRQKLTIILLLVYWPGIFIIAHIPIPEVVYKAQVSDKSLHFLAYLVLTFLLWFAISPVEKVNWRRATAWLILVVVVWYGVVDELLQGWVVRSCDGRDLLADFVGVLAGLILFSFLSFWPGLLVVTAIVIFGLTNLARANLADLVPVMNAMFHFFAYGFFTAVWIKYIQSFLPIKTSLAKRLITALVPPLGFLFIVKLSSVIFGRNVGVEDVLISIAGITTAVVIYLTVFLRRRSVWTLSSDA
jgi:VanZ family protein